MTLRLRLTLLYGGCFLVAGAALLAITYGLVAGDPFVNEGGVLIHAGPVSVVASPFETKAAFGNTRNATAQNATSAIGATPGAAGESTTSGANRGRATTTIRPPAGSGASASVVPPWVVLDQAISKLKRSSQKQVDLIAHKANVAIRLQHAETLRTLLTRSGIALAFMALLSVGLGWLVAGRALRPLRTMNTRAREITADSLHERLGADAGRDELGELAHTFDGLLGRLQQAFGAQRRFVANASHELRTPLTLQRAVLEVALADPDASTESLRHACERALASNAQQERLIDGLLTLARGQASAGPDESVDLAAIAGELTTLRAHDTPHLRWDTELEPAVVRGDPVLLERLIANLIDNAVAYNAPLDGWVAVSTATAHGRVTLRVANPGSVVPADRVQDMFEPFHRLEGERLSHGRGVGLGLSIVRAIADASRAVISARPGDSGGLEISVAFAATAPRTVGGRSPEPLVASPE